MKHWNVLIVDDEEVNIDILLEIIDDDYDISVALDGETALECVADALPDLILLDVMLPGISGYEVCTQLQQNSATKHIPIIFVSAKNSKEDQQKGIALGAVGYLNKPIDSVLLREKLRMYLH